MSDHIQLFIPPHPKPLSWGLLSVPSSPAGMGVGGCPDPGAGPCPWPRGTSWGSHVPSSPACHHPSGWCPFPHECQPLCVPPPMLGDVRKLAEGAVDPAVPVPGKDVQSHWSQ